MGSPCSFQGTDSASACDSGRPSFGLSNVDNLSTADMPQKLTGPWLLGQEMGPAPNLMVKNTFIDVQEEQEEGLPFCASQSCPVVKMPIPQSDIDASSCFGVAFGRFGEDEPRVLTVQYLQSSNSKSDESPAYILPRELAESLQSPAAAAAPRVVAFPPTETQAFEASNAFVLAPGVQPLEVRQPEMSSGAVLHSSEDCRPCAWFWRPQGCNNGEDCRHCHLCPQGEVKARRKSKITSMRKQGRAERADRDAEHVQAAVEPQLAAPGRLHLQLTSLV